MIEMCSGDKAMLLPSLGPGAVFNGVSTHSSYSQSVQLTVVYLPS